MDLGPIPTRFAPPAGDVGPVHVEGGPGPQPSPAYSDLDPEIAQMDATVTGRDLFGRLGE